MTILASLELNATLTNVDALQTLDLSASFNAGTIPLGELARLDGLIDDALVESLQPVGEAREQILGGFRLTLNGVLVDPALLAPGGFYTETIDGDVTFGVTLIPRGDEPAIDDPLGGIDLCFGPPGGNTAADLDFVYLTESGPRSVRLVTNGLVENTNRSYGPAGSLRTLTYVGTVGRHVQKLVDIEIPPGAGLLLSDQVETILSAMGISTAVQERPLIGGERLHREVQVRDSNGVELIRSLCHPFGKVFGFDRGGLPIIRDRRPAAGIGVVTWDFTGPDVLLEVGNRAELSDSSGPTEVCMAGTEQRVEAESDFVVRSGLAIESETGLGAFSYTWHNYRSIRRAPITVSESAFVPKAAQLTQASNCVQTATGFSPAAREAVVLSRTVTEAFDFCTLTISDSVTNAWYAVETAIQRTNTPSGFDCLVVFILDAQSQRGMATQTERFQQVDRTEHVRAFDSKGRLVAEQTDTFSWYAPREAVFTWNPGPERYDQRLDILLFRGIDGVSPNAVPGAQVFLGPGTEQFILTKRVAVFYDENDENFVIRKRTEVSNYFVVPTALGQTGSFLYGDGRVSLASTETFGLFETIEVLFEPLAGDSSHRETTVIRRADSASLVTEVSASLPGYLPAAEMRDDILPDPAEFPFGRPTCLSNSREIEGCWTGENLKGCRPARTLRLSSDRVETADQARELARAELRERSAIEVAFAIPLNCGIAAGDRCDLAVEAEGLSYTGLTIVTVDHRQNASGGFSQITAELDVV